MKKKINTEKRDLILAYFRDELSPDEKNELEEWLKESPANEEDLKTFGKDYLLLKWLYEGEQINVRAGHEKVFRTIRPKRNYWLYRAVAASLLLIIGSLFWLNREEETTAPGQLSDLNSGRNPKIELTLSDGQVIDVFRMTMMLSESGLTIDVDSVKGLVYHLPDTNSLADRVESYNKIKVPRGGEFTLVLSDGTQVWLNAESELCYPVPFTGDSREVSLRGEAYFLVTKDDKKPFLIKSDEFSMQVYGTEFNLNTYDPEHIELALVEGSVGFRSKPGSEEVRLQPDHLGVANSRTGASHVLKTDLYPYVAWRNNDMVFADERLESILKKVARWYDVDVFFVSEAAKELTFEINVPRYAKIEELLSLLERTSNVRFRVIEKRLEVSLIK